MKSKKELALEIEQAKQQLRERERERRIMKWLVLVMNTHPYCSNNCLYYES